MQLSCKEGDLAVVIDDTPPCAGNIGRIVEVRGPVEHNFRGLPCWLIKPVSPSPYIAEYFYRCITLIYVTPTDYAADELDLWKQALREQRRAERELDAAGQKRRPKRVIELMPMWQALRTRADLLLAEAVKVKCSFTTQKIMTDWVSTTMPGALQVGASA
jgi:hypothetical protein